MPAYHLDDATAQELNDMAARRGVPPEALLAELISRAGGRGARPRMQPTLTADQLKAIDEDKRAYWDERRAEQQREDAES